MSGGKGGSTTSSVEIPEYIERAAQENLNRAQAIGQMGYVPYYGPDVAAFTPMQEAAMQNVASAAGAFGLAAPTGAAMIGVPQAQTFGSGIRGYSSAPLFEQAQAELAARRPAQKAYIDSFFIDPVTGAYGANAPALVDYTMFGTGGGAGAAAAAAANDSPTRIPVNDRINYAAADDAAGGAGRMYYGQNEKGDVVSVGYGANQVDPGLAAAAGYTRREDNPFNYTIGEHFSAMGRDLSNMATQVASDIGKISPVANILKAVSSSKKDDSNNSRISIPKPKPKPKPKKKKKKSTAQKKADKFTASKIKDFKAGKKVTGF